MLGHCCLRRRGRHRLRQPRHLGRRRPRGRCRWCHLAAPLALFVVVEDRKAVTVGTAVPAIAAIAPIAAITAVSAIAPVNPIPIATAFAAPGAPALVAAPGVAGIVYVLAFAPVSVVPAAIVRVPAIAAVVLYRPEVPRAPFLTRASADRTKEGAGGRMDGTTEGAVLGRRCCKRPD